MGMDKEVLIALLSLLGTFIGAGGGVLVSNKLINFRLDQIEKKLDKNTDVQDEIKERLVIVEESSKSAHHRIDDIVDQLKIHERRQ